MTIKFDSEVTIAFNPNARACDFRAIVAVDGKIVYRSAEHFTSHSAAVRAARAEVRENRAAYNTRAA